MKHAALDPFNKFGVTAHQGRVVAIGKFPLNIDPRDALELAAWLIVAAELADVHLPSDEALELVRDAVRVIEAT